MLSVLSLVRIGIIIHPSQAMHGLDSGVRHDTTPADGDDRIMAGALTRPSASERGRQAGHARETRSIRLSLSLSLILSVLLVEVQSHLTLKCSTLRRRGMSGRRLNGFLGQSVHDRAIPFLVILLVRTVSVGQPLH